jgi:ribosome-binding factor A
MPTRRQEKVARVVKQAVSDAIANHLGDPRIEGLVSVTRVDMTADLRKADVYVSILADNPKAEDKTFHAIHHATHRIQSLVADAVHSKFCPVLHIHKDDKFKKTLEIMNLIDQAASEYRDPEEALEDMDNPPG